MFLSSIMGHWIFVALIYRGQRIPPLNPLLHIELVFDSSEESDLRYWRMDEVGFCHRRAHFSFDAEHRILRQEVVWIDPKNREDCEKDPDFQLGKISWSEAWRSSNEFLMSLPLGDESLTYVFSLK